jgi:hypothetical protein
MLKSDARRNVTRVQNQHVAGIFAGVNQPRNSRDDIGTFGDSDDSISFWTLERFPQPVFAGLVHVFPETLNVTLGQLWKWFTMGSHFGLSAKRSKFESRVWNLFPARLSCILALFLLPLPALARERLQGFCMDGNGTVTVSGTTATVTVGTANKTMKSFPSCLVTVYNSGTTTLATLYADNSGTSKANPFTAAATGQWHFYASDGRYDVRLSGGGISTPFTLSDFKALDWGTLGASGTVLRSNGSNAVWATLGASDVPTLPNLSGTLTAAKGGTGRASYTKGQILIASAGTTLTPLSVGTNDQVLTAASGETTGVKWAAATPAAHVLLSTSHSDTLAGTVVRGDILRGNSTPAWSRLALGAANRVLRSDGTDASWGQVVLTTDVSGVLPTAQGGTSSAYFTVAGPTIARTYTFPDSNATILTSAATVAVSNGGTGISSTAKGDILAATGSSTLARLPVGSDGQILSASSGASTGLAWGWRHLTGTATLDFPSTNAQLSADLTIAVTGAAVGNPVMLGTPAAPDANSAYTAFISASGVCTVRFHNYSSGAINPASASYTVIVIVP